MWDLSPTTFRYHSENNMLFYIQKKICFSTFLQMSVYPTRPSNTPYTPNFFGINDTTPCFGVPLLVILVCTRHKASGFLCPTAVVYYQGGVTMALDYDITKYIRLTLAVSASCKSLTTFCTARQRQHPIFIQTGYPRILGPVTSGSTPRYCICTIRPSILLMSI